MSGEDTSDGHKGQTQRKSGALSRRALFHAAAVVTGSATLFAAGVATSAARADAAKLSKAAAAYQDKPQGEQNCANCSLFLAPAACGVVEGTISASGWCKLYQKSA